MVCWVTCFDHESWECLEHYGDSHYAASLEKPTALWEPLALHHDFHHSCLLFTMLNMLLIKCTLSFRMAWHLLALNKHITQQCKHVPSYHCLFFYFSQGVKKSGGPCGGRDCSGGCQCFPEKGARVSFIVLAHPSIFIHPMPLWWIYSLPFMHNAKHRISGNVSRNILICVLISQFHARNKIQYYNG